MSPGLAHHGLAIPPERAGDRPVVGVDGARGGWVAATLAPGAAPELAWFADFAAVLAMAVRIDAAVVGVDMPIGLPADGPRESDRHARQILGPRRSSLFPTPVRAVLDASDHADAVARSRAACGKGISIQTWNLVPAIRQVRAAIASTPEVLVVETHPETSFTVMAGRPLAPKKTPEGRAERIEVLAGVIPGTEVRTAALDPSVFVGENGEPLQRRRRPMVDDLLDALAAAWSARRVATGVALSLGESSSGGVDGDGYSQLMYA